MDQTEFYALLLDRYQRGECTTTEIRALEQWYEQLGHERPPLTLSPAEQAALGAALWQRVVARTLDAEPEPATMVPMRLAGRPWYVGAGRWAAAAVLLAGLGLGARYALRPPAGPAVGRSAPTASSTAAGWLRYTNTTAVARVVRLNDGSRVAVAPGGQLRYPRHFAAGRRTVYLVGEAFFTVMPDLRRPFRVYTRQVVTTVLGTSFRVTAPAGNRPAVVKVRTGRVRVAPRPAPLPARPTGLALAAAPAPAPVLLLPNQQAVYWPARRALTRELVAEPVQVMAQSFAFDDRPATEVLAALEKAYGIPISYDAAALAGCSVTLNLPPQASLFAKLDVLSKTLGGSYEKEGTRLRFRSPGCRLPPAG